MNEPPVQLGYQPNFPNVQPERRYASFLAFVCGSGFFVLASCFGFLLLFNAIPLIAPPARGVDPAHLRNVEIGGVLTPLFVIFGLFYFFVGFKIRQPAKRWEISLITTAIVQIAVLLAWTGFGVWRVITTGSIDFLPGLLPPVAFIVAMAFIVQLTLKARTKH